jgi:hypothetical protein
MVVMLQALARFLVVCWACWMQVSESVKVGFLGDSDDEANAARNFRVMRESGVDVVVHNGDFDYNSSPSSWESFLARELGSMFFLGTSGNHEDDRISTLFSGGKKWKDENGYQANLFSRLQRGGAARGVRCTGSDGSASTASTLGDLSACELPDSVLVVMVGWNVISDSLLWAGGDQGKVEAFLENALSRTTARHKVCVWHRPEGALNPGERHTANYKTQKAFNICAKYGAWVTTGHTHVYGRSKLLANFASLAVSALDTDAIVRLDCGRSISVINGMGGAEIDKAGNNAGKAHLRRVYTASTGKATNGVLICDFQANTTCQFKINDGNTVYDQFTLTPPRNSKECQKIPAPLVVQEQVEEQNGIEALSSDIEPAVIAVAATAAISVLALTVLLTVVLRRRSTNKHNAISHNPLHTTQ